MSTLKLGLITLIKESKPLFIQLEYGSEIEKNNAFQQIYTLAKTTEGMEQLNDLAVAIARMNKYDQALEFFQELNQKFPGQDVLRYNMALTYSYTQKIDLCRYYLTTLSRSASSEEFCNFCQDSLHSFDAHMGLTEADKRLKELQIRYFRKAIQGASPDNKAYFSLGRLLMEKTSREMDDANVEEVIFSLEKGLSQYPQDIPLLQMLLSAKIWFEPYKSHYELADRLARISPHSSLLTHYSTRKTSDAVMKSGISSSFQVLLNDYINGDDELRSYALKDMARFVFLDPSNSDYRVMYALTLASLKDHAAALRHLAKAEQDPNKGYMFYFNVCQILDSCGDNTKAMQYAEIAMSYAKTEEDKLDLEAVIARIKK